jgi:hypothetical protein
MSVLAASFKRLQFLHGGAPEKKNGILHKMFHAHVRG